MSRFRFQSTDTGNQTSPCSVSSDSLSGDSCHETKWDPAECRASIVEGPEQCIEEAQCKEGGSNSTSTITNWSLKNENHEEPEARDKTEKVHFNRWVRFMNCVRYIITESVTAIATLAARNPKRAVWGITFLSFALVGIGYLTNFNMNVAADVMYTPKNSRIRERQHWVEEVSGFPEVERNLRMIVHNDNGDGNVLNIQTVEAVFEAINTVREMPGYEEACANSDFKDDLGNTTCRIRGVSLFWNNSLETFRARVPSDTDVILQVSGSEYPDKSPVDVLEIMGMATEHRGFATVYARAFFLDIALPSTALDFELGAVENLLKLRSSWHGSTLGLEILAFSSLENETTRSVLRDIPLVPLVFLVMSAFTCFIFSKRDKVRSRSLLGFGAVICIFMSVISGYGLMFLFGVNFTALSQILPFVMFGVGLDDIFIIMGAYNRTDPNKDVIDRIQETFRDIGLSIFLTTLTTCVAFGFGCTSNLPALYWLSFYAFTTMAMVFLYTITFFVGLIVLDERRIQENRRDCCAWITVAEDKDDETFQNTEEGREAHSAKNKRPELKADDETNNAFIRYAGWYADFLMKPAVKVVVLVSALAVACFFAYCTSLFKQEFNVTEMLPGDSYAKGYMTAADNYGQRGWLVPAAYFRNVDQSDPDVQQQMEEYIDGLVGIDAITEQPPLFWLRHFKTFLTYDDRLLDLTFNQQLDIFLSHSPFKELFGPHVVRDEESGEIIASRCILYMDNIDVNSVANQLKARKDQQEVTAAQQANEGLKDFNFFLWESQMFTWDFYASTANELTVSTVMGVAAVTVIGFAFIPHWSAILFLFPLIIVLYIDLMGFLQFLGYSLNVVSYFALVISIGLLVDFLIHMMLRYHECRGETREAKVKEALMSMGADVLVAGLSTLLGVLPLAFSTSELMRTIFVAFIGMVGLGVTHGLMVLPVLLSLVGPVPAMKKCHTIVLKQEEAKHVNLEAREIEQDVEC